MEEARKELERALEDAELAYRTGAIEYEQNLITAEYTRDSAILTGQQAKDVYDETVAKMCIRDSSYTAKNKDESYLGYGIGRGN